MSNHPCKFAETAEERVKSFLAATPKTDAGLCQPLTPDASTREYFRVKWGAGTAMVAAYAEAFKAQELPFLDVTALLKETGLPVPEIYHVEESLGLVIQEDFGDRQLSTYLRVCSADDADRLRDEAIDLIAKFQQTTELAFKRKSIAGVLAFDFEKLFWELEYFYEHFFGSLRKERLSKASEKSFKQELKTLAEELADCPRTLCHRDFHAGNLLVDAQGRLRVIDYQDARMGPASYDLVSLLLDRVLVPPALSEIRAGRLQLLAARAALGLPPIEAEAFTQEFRLMTVQRVLKAIGTFSYQTGARGRGTVYGAYIQPMLQVALQAAELLERFPQMRKILTPRAAESYQ